MIPTNTLSRTLLLALQIVAGFSSPLVSRGEVRVERIFMPNNAYPSSFAVGLPGEMNFCFDPVRGALSYAWTGGFIDPSPARNGIGKFVDPVKLLGPVVYQESGKAPLRRGDAVRMPVVRFTGYTLRADAIEFRYAVDGVAVREEIRGRADGTALERRLHIAGGGAAKWWYVQEGKPPFELKADADGVFQLEVPLGKATP
jgi:hypothetical protein